MLRRPRASERKEPLEDTQGLLNLVGCGLVAEAPSLKETERLLGEGLMDGSGMFDFGVVTGIRPAPGDHNYRRRYSELCEEARHIEALGYRTFSTAEQHYMADDGHLGAQLTALAGIATITSRIQLLTNTLLIPLYKWRQVVEEAVVVDNLSNGRLNLGVAAGGNEVDYSMFGVDFSDRGRLMEEGLKFIRQGLNDGQLPDGPSGRLLPITPRPVQSKVPILVGGLSPPAVDRAVRLGDGHIAYTYEAPESNLRQFWDNRLLPALQLHHRSLSDFRFTVLVPLWIADDPEREWEVAFKPAFAFHMNQYLRRYRFKARLSGGRYVPPGITTELRREHLFVDTPERIADRLVDTWRSVPWHELIFFYRLPGITHERALEHLQDVAHRLRPLLAKANLARTVQ